MRSCALIVLALVVSAAFGEPNTPSLLKNLESRYNRAQSLEVQFSETYSGAGRVVRTESGTLTLRKPGRMRWNYSAPSGKWFMSDGKFAYLYSPDSQLVEEISLKDTVDMRAPLAFLLGKLNFDKEFQNIQATAADSGTRIVAEPKAANLPYSKVEFEVSPKLEIQKLRISGQDGSLLDFTFSAERLNPAVDDKMFRLQVPAGAKLVKAGQ